MNSLGYDCEDRAVSLLEDQGLRLLERNFSGKTGEIDLIAQDGTYLVFVEVRARSNRLFESAAGSVNTPCRFDVIVFEPPQSGTQLRIRWIRSAFTA